MIDKVFASLGSGGGKEKAMAAGGFLLLSWVASEMKTQLQDKVLFKPVITGIANLVQLATKPIPVSKK